MNASHHRAAALVGLALTASPAWPQRPSPSPLAVTHEKVRGVELRYVPVAWRPEIFKRPWAFAWIGNDVPLKIGEKTLPAGQALLVLNPNADGKGMSLEWRAVEKGRSVSLDVLAPPPPGETLWAAPAWLEMASVSEPRLLMGLADSPDGAIELTFHYGNRRFTLDLSRVH
jgi:hypothetical protein